MRNFKKILSLVLAMAMMLSVMVVGAGAAFADQDDITPAYEEAVAVLSGTGVFEGFEDGTFGPQKSITRAQTAAIIYRVVTGDVNDEQVDVYADYNVFKDVKSTDWFAGYVNFCANAEFILGYGDGKFGPQDKVTGYQALAMILRAVGYDQEGEFAGPNWLVNTASVAKELKLLENVVAGDTLGVAADRELVAELLFQAINVPTVTHTPALGYKDYTVTLKGKVQNETLGEKAFDLACKEDVIDNWGRPSDKWFGDADRDNVIDSKEDIYATINEAPVAVYTKAVTECNLAKDLGLKENANYTSTLNAIADANGTINLTDTTTKIGAQGRLTEVYDNGNDTYSIVMADQFLAKVGKVTEVKYDANGHISAQATMALTIYDKSSATTSPVTLKADANFAYAEGDMVLVYAKAYDNDITDVKDGEYEVGTEVAVADVVAMAEVIGLAKSVDGKQTAFTTIKSHVVNGTEYMDAVQFNLDKAGNDTGSYTWYFDTYGNLIGDVVIETVYNYGTISEIYWVDSHDGEDGYAKAKITYMDGSSAYATIATIAGLPIDSAEGAAYVDPHGKDGVLNVSSTKAQNEAGFVNVALFKIAENDDGELDLTLTTALSANIVKNKTDLGNGVNADVNTKFLVWNGETYETYTGIKSVPTYNACSAWYAETDNDNGVEYVFVIDPSIPAEDSSVLYFFNTSDLTIKTTLKNGAPDYYTITGGYVNGVKDDIVIDAAGETKYADNAKYQALIAQAGQLSKLALKDGYVDVVTAIDAEPVAVDDDATMYAVELTTYSLNEAPTLLTTTIDSVEVDFDVSGTIAFVDMENKWDDATSTIWVVYTDKDYDVISVYG